MAGPFVTGLGIAAVAMTARGALQVAEKVRHNPEALKHAQAAAAGMKGMGNVFKNLPGLGSMLGGNAGKGFEATMSRREAAQILGVREMSNKADIKAAHRKIMMLNHPDRGGSPYVASKINEAAEVLQGTRRSSGSAFS
mmetsp:Transcript_35493/g.60852  ORF Transcript_35493/g.60852 Transcript_35493/m.60852 type:complete len:139 (+) Transcript_35493:67-483(+)